MFRHRDPSCGHARENWFQILVCRQCARKRFNGSMLQTLYPETKKRPDSSQTLSKQRFKVSTSSTIKPDLFFRVFTHVYTHFTGKERLARAYA